MSMVREYGTFDASLEARRPISEINLQCTPLDVIAHWRRCSMMADFGADFLAYNFENVDVARNIISTVLNELLENAVKFSARKREKISVSLAHYGELVRISTINVATAERVASLTSLIKDLQRDDLDWIFVSHIERSAVMAQPTSGLGLISMRNDYHARVGVRLTMLLDESHEVLVNVLLDVEELEQSVESRRFPRV